jgi:hypothetical protein
MRQDGDRSDEHVCVGTFTRPMEAELARGLLESEGITVALLDAHVTALGLGPAVSVIRLVVPAHQARLALQLLAAPPGDAPDPEEPPRGPGS